MTIRLRSLLTFPYLLLLLAVALLSLWLSQRDAEHALDDLADQLLAGLVHHVTEHLGHLAANAFQPLYLTRRMLEEGELSLEDERGLAAHLRRQVNSHEDAVSLGIGDMQGRYTAFSRLDPPGMVWYTDRIWVVDESGEQTRIFSESPEYDPRARPWFQAGLRSEPNGKGKGDSQGEAWSEVYHWQPGTPLPTGERYRVAQGQSGISAVLPLRDGEGRVLAVLENALTLGQLSDYLRKVQVGTYGFSLLFDAQGHLLAHSGKLDAQGEPEGPLAEVLAHLRTLHAESGLLARNLDMRLESGGKRLFLRMVPLADPRGGDWRVVVAIPEQEFNGAILGHAKRTLLLLLVSALGIALIGWRLAAAISRPVERLSRAAAGMELHGWSAPPTGGIVEVAELGRSMGQMTQRLERAFGELESQVEQRTSELSESRRTLATLLANLPGMAYRCRNDRDWTMQFVSDGCYGLTGYTPNELIDNRVLAFNDLIWRDDREAVWQEVQQATAERRPFRMAYRIQTCDERVRWVWEQGIGLVDDQGNLTALEGFITDISELKDTQFALERAKQQAEAANQAKSLFLSNMSHEIRTPLNSILGFAELLEPRIAGEKEREYLEAIRISGRSLRVLIDDILELSRMESGKLVLSRAPTDLRQLAQQMQTMFGQTAREKGIEIRLELEPGLPAAVLLDGNRLRQILVNLLGNAVKFTDCGFVELRIHSVPSKEPKSSQPSAPVPESRNGGRCVELWVEVFDTGRGIPREDQHRIFEPFEQQEDAPGSLLGGTGLGLAIVRRLSEAMQGRMHLHSVPGEGSRFSLELHNVPVVAVEEKLLAPNVVLTTPANVRPATLVIADDVAMNRRLLRGLLEDFPFRLIEAADGEATLAVVRAEHPDLLLLDMRMPGLSGQQVARILRAEPATRHIPIVAITAMALEEELKEVSALCDACLTKPVDYLALYEVLGRLLGART